MECRSPEWSVQFRKIPPARLAAVGKKLDTMLQAVKLARSALDDFYATLSDEQKFQFEAIDPRRSSDQPQNNQTPPRPRSFRQFNRWSDRGRARIDPHTTRGTPEYDEMMVKREPPQPE
jgi:hypothetical protein